MALVSDMGHASGACAQLAGHAHSWLAMNKVLGCYPRSACTASACGCCQRCRSALCMLVRCLLRASFNPPAADNNLSGPLPPSSPLPASPLPGLPESVSKLKQALLRGYAVAAMSSADRSTGGGGRCWKASGHGGRCIGHGAIGHAGRCTAHLGLSCTAQPLARCCGHPRGLALRAQPLPARPPRPTPCSGLTTPPQWRQR